MKIRFLHLLTVCCAAVVLLSSCEKNKSDGGGGGGGGDDTETTTEKRNKWVYNELSEWYLWRDVVLSKTPNYKTSDYKAFFYGMLSPNHEDGYKNSDGSHTFYSIIDRESVSTRSGVSSTRSFGFEFTIAKIDDVQLCFVITYVVPGSPAYNKGLRRGHTILKVNNDFITVNNYENLYPLLLTELYTGQMLQPASVYGAYFADPDNPSETITNFEANLVPAPVVDNAVHHSEILALDNGKKVGYMVYNFFDSGYPNISNSDFDNNMKRVFREFATAGVSDLMLDLRYNGGGLTSSALLMASMVNGSYANQVFNIYKYNPYTTNKYLGGTNPTDKMLTADQMKNSWANYNGQRISRYGTDEGANLGLTRLFVLTTKATASSSELIITGLRGLLGNNNVIQVGETSHGKAVGMTMRYAGGKFDGYNYILWPVSFVSHNKNDVRTPVGGWVPDIKVDVFNGGVYYPFGDRRDPLLGATIDYIEGRQRSSTQTKTESFKFAAKSHLPSSIESRPGRGMLRIE